MIWVMGSTLSVAYAHSLLMVAPGGAISAPFIAMIIIGFGYTICAASLWPSVAILVKESELGTAYGTMTSVQNTGLAIAPIVVGLITNDPNHPDYRYAELFFVACALVSFFLCILVAIIDRTGKKRLTISPSALKEAIELEKLEEFSYSPIIQ